MKYKSCKSHKLLFALQAKLMCYGKDRKVTGIAPDEECGGCEKAV